MCESRRDLHSMPSEVDISLGAVQLILANTLGMSKVSARWVPQMLTHDQKRTRKRTRLNISRYLLSGYEDDPGDFLKQVLTKGETWIHHFDQSKKCRANNGITPATTPYKFKRVHSAGKVMALIF